jgi:hypothetical protein
MPSGCQTGHSLLFFQKRLQSYEANYFVSMIGGLFCSLIFAPQYLLLVVLLVAMEQSVSIMSQELGAPCVRAAPALPAQGSNHRTPGTRVYLWSSGMHRIFAMAD